MNCLHNRNGGDGGHTSKVTVPAGLVPSEGREGQSVSPRSWRSLAIPAFCGRDVSPAHLCLSFPQSVRPCVCVQTSAFVRTVL
jgi:hypothetical protein